MEYLVSGPKIQNDDPAKAQTQASWSEVHCVTHKATVSSSMVEFMILTNLGMGLFAIA